MDTIVLSIILSLVFIAHILLVKFVGKNTWLFALLWVVAFDVAPMSHLWHIIYGEDRIRCPEAKDEPFGWTPCFEPTWNNFVNTYELTLPIEFLFLAGLVYYTHRGWFVRILNSLLVILALMLLFSPPLFLDGFYIIFDWTSFLISIIMLLVAEIGI